MAAMSKKDVRSEKWSLPLKDYFCVPYRLEAMSIETPDGNWLRHVAYPELPGCSAAAPGIEEALAALEAKRLQMIIDMIRQGEEPPVPRAPVQSCDPLWLAEQTGLSAELNGLLVGSSCAVDQHSAFSKGHSNAVA